MKTNRIPLVITLLVLTTTLALADPLGTAFTYQGRLTDSGGPATGLYDFQFALCDAATGGSALGTKTVAAAPVTNGLYTVALDFGANAFDGNARWLALSVRTNGGIIWTTLTPRLALTPTPYAIRATTAGGVSGVIPDSQLSANIARLNGTNVFIGPVTAPSFSGNGSSLSGVAPASGSPNYVAKAGDTMTGTLTLPSIALRVGAGQALQENYYGLNGLSINPNEDWPYTAIRGKVGIGNFAGTLVPTASVDIMGDNTELKIRPYPSAAGGATLTLLGQGSSTNKVRINLQSVTLESASGGADYLKISNNTKDVAYFGSDGNVGIGTTTPGAPLEIFSGFDTDALRFGRSSADRHSISTKFDGSIPTGNYLGFNIEHSTGDTRRVMTLQGDGSVGIGTANPGALLHLVSNNPDDSGGIRIERTSATTGRYNLEIVSNGDFQLTETAIAPRLSVQKASGNIGIGTTSPSATLDVNGTIKAATFVGSGAGISSISPGAIASGTVSSSLQFNAPPLFLSGFSVGTSQKVNGLNADLLDGLDSTSFAPVSGSPNYVGTSGDTMSGPLYLPANGLTAGGTQLVLAGGYVGVGTSNPQATLDVHGTTRTCVLSITGGCDVAEPFPLASQGIPKGSVVVIDDENPGQLKLSSEPYDQRVAGIVSGANGINPGITLSQQGALEGGQNVALSGRVYVLADAANGPIKPGDLLTSSTVPGHAMKVTDHAKAQGAILGKAMSRLPEGRGLVLVLVTLQ